MLPSSLEILGLCFPGSRPPWILTEHELLALGVNICASSMTPAYPRPLRPDDWLQCSLPLRSCFGSQTCILKAYSGIGIVHLVTRWLVSLRIKSGPPSPHREHGYRVTLLQSLRRGVQIRKYLVFTVGQLQASARPFLKENGQYY